jgi:hypothetical protein
MFKKLALLLSFIVVANLGKAQFGQYYSLSVYGQASGLSNYHYLPYQSRIYFSGGFEYGFSLTQYLNLKLGVNTLNTYINNGKEAHSICELPGNTCFSEAEVLYINSPISIEFYQNGGKTGTKTFYNITLHPMFSINEKLIKSEIYDVPEVALIIDTFEVKGFKFQDLHIGFSLGSDIALSRKFKFYFEPSIQHSILFRKEDLINPNYLISLKLGFKIRSYRR